MDCCVNWASKNAVKCVSVSVVNCAVKHERIVLKFAPVRRVVLWGVSCAFLNIISYML